MKATIPKTPLILTLLATAHLLAAPPVESPYNMPQPPFFGQVRARTEYDLRDVRDTSANKALFHTHLRTRLGFTAAPSPNTELKVEFQDTRFFGSEPGAALAPHTASVGNRDGVDLLQGYFAIEEGPFKTVFGRQKIHLGAGRFLSTLEWHPYSRAFDGWSFNLNLDPANLTGVAFLVNDSSQAAVKDRQFLAGLHYTHQAMPGVLAEAYGFYDQGRLAAASAGVATRNHDLVHLGERIAGKLGAFLFEEEFVWQAGELAGASGADLTSAAFQLALRLGVALGGIKANAGLEMMSGDADAPAGDGEVNTYRANYYFAHAYFGWMDYFVNNPRYGVTDYRIDADIPLLADANGNPKVTLKPQYHLFTPQDAPTSVDGIYGQEIDFEAHLALYPKSNIVLGAGLFLPGDAAYLLPAAKAANGQDTRPGLFLYFMPVFNF